MASRVSSTNRVITTEQDARLAHGVLKELDGPDGVLRVEREGRLANAIPPEVGRILQQVLTVIAQGGSVTISATPNELTTSSAAGVLGISRPTLAKMVSDGRIPAHKVGSHMRFRSDDVFAELRARRARERAAFEALRELEGDDDS